MQACYCCVLWWLHDLLAFDCGQSDKQAEWQVARPKALIGWFLSLPLGLSQICSKTCPKCFQEFPKFFTHYALSVFLLCLHYAPKLATCVAIILEHLNQ